MANPYAYAGNNPVNLFDPAGLRPITTEELDAYRKANAPKWGTALAIVAGVGLAFVPGAQGFAAALIAGAVLGGGASIIDQACSGYPIDWGQVGKDTLFGLGGGAFGYGVGKGLQWAAKTPIGQKVLWKVGGQLRQIPGIKQLSDKGMGFGRYTNTASEARTRHILFGDSPRSGGHHWPAQPPVEVGMQGKTPFPLRWSDDKIMHEISEIANDPTLNWVQQGGKPGATHYKSMKPMRYAVDVERHGLHFRVVTEPLGEGVITGYLTQRPPLGPGALAVRNEFALATTHIDD